ncbi:Group XV phospholipase A2 [Schistosoma japonicum]|nr:Group XV phospholipase A2 [Schistosoma japonicum]
MTVIMYNSILLIYYIFLTGISLMHTIPLLTVINKNNTNAKYPIILIPGLGGTQAYCESTINDEKKSFTPFNVWLNFPVYTITCNVTFPGWGDTWSVEYLSQHISYEYFAPIVSEFIKDAFYVRNFTLRGAPYDFRKSPIKLRKLIEETYKNGFNRPVVLLGHSMGSIYTLHFLKHQTKRWKQKYIKSFISVSAPFGDNFGIFLRSPLPYRDLFRTMTSIIATLPNPKLWSKDEVLIVTPHRNYTVLDYPQYFSDADYLTGYNLFTRFISSFDPLEPPKDVPEVYCIYGSGLLSVEQIIFQSSSLFVSSFPNQSPRIIYGNGDGTVNLRSLQVCKKWPSVKVVEISVSGHRQILNEKRFIDFLKYHVNT